MLETHLHNDYISGGPPLAKATGAELVVRRRRRPAYRHRPAFHHEDIVAAELTVRPIHTPGHTPEHTSYLALLEGSQVALFSGGSLLVGSAGRSDLLGPERAESLARLQYGSVNRLPPPRSPPSLPHPWSGELLHHLRRRVGDFHHRSGAGVQPRPRLSRRGRPRLRRAGEPRPLALLLPSHGPGQPGGEAHLHPRTEAVAAGALLLDVRAPREWGRGTVAGSVLRYLPDLVVGVPAEIDPEREVLVACATGFRSAAAVSPAARSR